LKLLVRLALVVLVVELLRRYWRVAALVVAAMYLARVR
jgi:hypothetical protein